MLVVSSLVLNLTLLSSLIVYLIIKYFQRKYKYWSNRGVPGPKPNLFFGNAKEIITLKQNIGNWTKNLYDSASDVPYFGIFVLDDPYLVVKSPELIKQILVKDFNYFSDRASAAPNHNTLYSSLLFFKKSPEWNSLRSKLSPTFSSGKLKNLFPIVTSVGKNFSEYIGKNQGNLDAKEVATKYGIDAITKVFFGINAHCLDDENAKFREVARDMFSLTIRNALIQTCYFFKNSFVNLFNLEFFQKHITDFFQKAFWKSVDSRKKENIRKNDFIDLLLDIQKKDPTFDGEKMAAQGVQFFAAGFETNSSTISFTLYELCINAGIQEKLRNEIKGTIAKHGGITYEGVNEMKYLDMCVMETLRKYPVLPFLDRRCNADYKIPGSNFVIEKGIPVYIPTFGLHYDERHFPDPEKYIPERFSRNVNIDKLIYFAFGYGPRVCIGERLGMLITKLGIIHVIGNYEVQQTKETPVPIKFDSKSFLLQSQVGLPMKFVKLQ